MRKNGKRDVAYERSACCLECVDIHIISKVAEMMSTDTCSRVATQNITTPTQL